jgi:hypothetical protein
MVFIRAGSGAKRPFPVPDLKGQTMKTILIAAAAAGILAPVGALAQQQACGSRQPIVDRLETKYGETRQSMGLNHNNGIVEVFASAETGTWTILITMPTGQSCLIAAGENWDIHPEPVAANDEDA